MITSTLHHHGAVSGVTGSCHELRTANGGLLVDCGLFQGDEAGGRGRNDLAIDFPIDHIKALIVTHAHLDHCGRIPQLWAAGFDGPILCSEPTAILLPLLLEDAIRIGLTRDKREIRRLIDRLKRRLRPQSYGTWQPVPGLADVTLRLEPAGHILGSAYVLVRVRDEPQFTVGRSSVRQSPPQTRSLVGRTSVRQTPSRAEARPTEERLTARPVTSVQRVKSRQTILFSGDLGPPHTPLLPAPRPPYGADVVVLESTYGDRTHEDRRSRRARLQRIIEQALKDRGAVLVPAFSLGRTQELLYELEGIVHAARDRQAARDLPWSELDIIVDSPLAARLTRAYRKLRPHWDAEARQRIRAGRHPLAFDNLTTITSHDQHLRLVKLLQRTARPCVVIAAAGMCQGGRIVNHLKALLPDPRTNVLFVGYQAHGTPGRAIQKYGPRGGWVQLDGERVTIHAGIHTVGGYSAHADQHDLVNFIRRMRRPLREVRLVHGDAQAKRALKQAIEGLGLDIKVNIPTA